MHGLAVPSDYPSGETRRRSESVSAKTFELVQVAVQRPGCRCKLSRSTTLRDVRLRTWLPPAEQRRVLHQPTLSRRRCTVLPWLLLATMLSCTPVPAEETLSEPAPLALPTNVEPAASAWPLLLRCRRLVSLCDVDVNVVVGGCYWSPAARTT